MKKAVLFDLDGVLLDTEGIYTEFWQGMGDRFGLDADFAYKIKGTTLTNILGTYFPEPEVQSWIRARLVEQERNMQYRLFDGALELLQNLKDAGVRTAVVTSSNAAKMRHVMAELPALARRIDTLVVDEDVTASKPDPQGYLLAAKRLEADAPHFAVVEDSLHGLEAGRRAGGIVVGIATTNPLDVVAGRSDIAVNTIGELDADALISRL